MLYITPQGPEGGKGEKGSPGRKGSQGNTAADGTKGDEVSERPIHTGNTMYCVGFPRQHR